MVELDIEEGARQGFEYLGIICLPGVSTRVEFV
jgi:hypothetical protein